jgi:hypothetical protein
MALTMKTIAHFIFNFSLINFSLGLSIPRNSSEHIDGFIVNGVPANIADFPWHLGLIDLRLGGNICGATNIS